MRKKWTIILCLALLTNIINYSSAQEANQITCTGKVVDNQGKPLTGVKVSLHVMEYGSSTNLYDTRLIKQVTTGTDGAFSFSTDAESDVYRYGYIVAEKKDLAFNFANWRMRDGDKKLQIEMGPPHELSGIVVDEKDKPVSGAQVSISMLIFGSMRDERGVSGPLALDLFTTTTNAAGKFNFTKIPSNSTAEFIIKKDGSATTDTYKSTGSIDQKLNFTAGQTDIKLVLPIEAKIQGIVVQKDTGKPVGGLQLTVRTDQGVGYFRQKPLIPDEDGKFSINALASGRYTLGPTRPSEGLADWIAEPVEVMVEAGKTASNVKIELSKGGILEALIKDAVNQKPLEKARISVRSQDRSQYQSSRTDKDGIARIRLLPGDYQISYIQKENYSIQRDQDTVTIEEGKTERVEFELAGMPKLTGIVRDEKGKPLKGVKLKVCPSGRDTGISQADGTFEVNYDPGDFPSEISDYILVCRYEEGNLAATAPIDEDTKFDITLKPAVIFTGKVLDPDGKGISSARVNIMIRGERWGSTISSNDRIVTNQEGKFEIKALPDDNRYNLYARADGYGENRGEEINTDDAINNHLDVGTITLEVANLSVSGIVVDDDEKPVAGARISCYGDNQPHRSGQTDTKGKFTLENVCAGQLRISANKSGSMQPRLYGSIETEGGATDVRIVISQRSTSTRYQPKRPASLIGRALPDLKDLNVNLSPADIDNKMILVCFWDMEQRPSRYYIRQVAKEAYRLKQKGIVVVAVQASKIDQNTLDEWVKKYKIPFTIGMVQTDTEKAKFKWGFRSLPWMILTDANHVVSSNGFSLNELNKKIELAQK